MMNKLLVIGAGLAAFAISAVAVSQTVLNPAQVAIACAYTAAGPPVPTSGQYYQIQCDANGNIITAAGSTVTVTTVGANSVTVPAGKTIAYIDSCSGGGSGGAAQAGAAASGGGGGGASYIHGYPLRVTAGSTLTVTIGAGGVVGVSSGTGGSTTITGGADTFPTLTGGVSGAAGSAGTGGGGGASGGLLTIAGSAAGTNGVGLQMRIAPVSPGAAGGGGASTGGGAGSGGSQSIWAGGAAGGTNGGGGGGASYYGAGGAGGATSAPGATPVGFCAGGGGGGQNAQVGGNGSQGIAILRF